VDAGQEETQEAKPTAAALKEKVLDVLQTVFDPEIPVNIYDLGLVYSVKADDEGNVVIVMTLTSPACPMAAFLPLEVERKVNAIPGAVSARVELAWNPPWNPGMMSEAARLQLGLF
jgi:FeS assembly SUF system protein